MKILNVEPDRYDEDLRRELARIGDVSYVDCASHEQFIEALSQEDFEAVFLRLGLALDRNALDACPSLRYALTPTTGLDHIDIGTAERRGVEVVSVKDEIDLLRDVRSTAEHTWALMLSLIRKLPGAHADVIAGHWRREPFLADEVFGKTLGIVGFGRLGQMVAEIGVAFGMNVVVYDRVHVDGYNDVSFVDMDQLLSTSDIVSLHLPLNETTQEFMSEERLARMRESAYLVNTARGELIDEDALLRCLVEKRLAGAALDVLTGDSQWASNRPIDHPLVEYAANHQNLIITPHIGGYGRQSIKLTRKFIVDQLARRVEVRSHS